MQKSLTAHRCSADYKAQAVKLNAAHMVTAFTKLAMNLFGLLLLSLLLLGMQQAHT